MLVLFNLDQCYSDYWTNPTLAGLTQNLPNILKFYQSYQNLTDLPETNQTYLEVTDGSTLS